MCNMDTIRRVAHSLNVVYENLSLCLVGIIFCVRVCARVAAREQLRRSRHSRTFLVESGTGELWSELQTGKCH